ncbi:hypothetical protein ACQCVP_18610 [Rossellomorea vietnamensis]
MYTGDLSGRRQISCGTSGTGDTTQAKLRRLTASPAEPGGWSGNPLFFQPHSLRKERF